MTNLEGFCPILKKGRMTPVDGRLLYEIDDPAQHIVLPIETADFLTLFDGHHTIGDVVEMIYKDRRTVPFRLILKTLNHLKERGFIVNPEGFESIDSADLKGLNFIGLVPSLKLNFTKRLFNDRTHPVLFYLVSMACILLGILSLPSIWHSSGHLEFLKLGHSYSKGLLFFFLVNSFLLSFRGILKTVLQMFLTGRAYNFGLTISPLSIHCHVSNESLFLVSRPLFAYILHSATLLSPLVLAVGLGVFWPNFPLLQEVYQIAALNLIFSLNPFGDNDLTQALRFSLTDDTLKRLSKWAKQNPYFAITRQFHFSGFYGVRYFLYFYSYVWSFLFLTWIGSSFFLHLNEGLGTLQAGQAMNKICAFVALTSLGTWISLVFRNQSVVLKQTLLTPVWQLIKRTLSRRRTLKMSYFKQDEVYKTLASLPLFNEFPRELLNMIVQKSKVQKIQKGTHFISKGEMGKELHILLNGRMAISHTAMSEKFTLSPPCLFGEAAVIEDCRRQADVDALTDAVVLSVPARTLREAAQNNRYIRNLSDFQNTIMLNQFFSSAPIFKDLSPSLVELIAARGQVQSFKQGQLVFSQGDIGDGFYLLLRGEVKVLVNDREMACIRQGGFFGEIALIADVPRTATLVANTAITVLRISRDNFWAILSKDIQLASFVEHMSESRMREGIEVIRGHLAKTG